MNRIVNRILAEMDCMDLLDKAKRLSRSDMNSLLLELYKLQISSIDPVDLVKTSLGNRFTRNSDIDPIPYHRLESDILDAARLAGIQPVLTSPVAPLGVSSVLGAVSQNNVLSATHGTEVISDATNLLALQLAGQLKTDGSRNVDDIHLCTTNRVIRAQMYTSPGMSVHFGLFSMVSSGQDTGSYRCEGTLLQRQLAFFSRYIQDKIHKKASIVLNRRIGYRDPEGFFDRMCQTLRGIEPPISWAINESESDNAYYEGLNYKITIETENGTVEIGDGGFTDWTRRMLCRKKERLLIGCVSLDRLLPYIDGL